MPDRTLDTDSLFLVPLAEFTVARNALAAALKKSGRRQEAGRVKALAKPSIPAWAVNQLYWRHRAAFDRLMSSGETLRTAQRAQLSGVAADLRSPLQARRDALAELTRLAAAVLEHAGHPPTPGVLRRVTTTLEALAAYGAAPDAPPAGRLVDDVDPPGFEALASLVPRTHAGETKPPGPSAVVPFRQRPPSAPAPTGDDDARAREKAREAERRAARAAVQAAEGTLRDARRLASGAEAALKAAATRVKKAEAAKGELEARLEEAAAQLTSARQEARRVAADAEDAAQAVTDAERALERAKQQESVAHHR